MKRIIILTGNELRHSYFKKKIALTKGIEVLRTYCETEENLLAKSSAQSSTLFREKHLLAREQSEKDFFEAFNNNVEDNSSSVVIKRGDINSTHYFYEITSLNPDLIIVYGASIIREPLLSAFHNRILNVHLGLSPYYRGAGTNFWPLVENKPECAGATFMYIDAGIDTGEIIHQLRSVYNYFDTPSAAGNRLIKDMTEVFAEIILRFEIIAKPETPTYSEFSRFCKKKDFTEEAVEKVYDNFKNGILEDYLEHIKQRNSHFPIVVNKALAT